MKPRVHTAARIPWKQHRHQAKKLAEGVGLCDQGRAKALAALAVQLREVTEEHARYRQRKRPYRGEVGPLARRIRMTGRPWK